MFDQIYKTPIEKDILQLEEEIFAKQKELTELRRTAPATEVSDYIFKDKNGIEKKLSELFDEKNEIMIVHNMGRGCSYCTLWADEFNGVAHHLHNRLPFFISSPDDVSVMKEFAESRNWKLNMLSTKENSFKKDMGFENAEAKPLPGVSVFVKRDGKIYHTAKTKFGPGDLFCGTWHLLDLLPNGANGWGPKKNYEL